MTSSDHVTTTPDAKVQPQSTSTLSVADTQTEYLRRLRLDAIRDGFIIWVFRLGLGAAFLVSWEYAANGEMIDTFFFSQPTDVWGFLVLMFSDGSVWRHIGATLQSTLIGFFLAIVTAIPFGLLLARFPLLDRIFAPYLAALNALPRVALAPIFILWFGVGIESKIVLVWSLVFFIILINTEAGVKSADRELLRLSQVMGATQRQIFMKIVLPGAVPSIFAGVRLGVIYSLLGTVVGEMVAAEAGLGQMVSLFSGTYRTGGVLAVLLLLSLMGVAMNGVMLLIERRLLRWQN
ncbi:MAG: ABC transporter permease [Pseudomonadota bacterium]